MRSNVLRWGLVLAVAAGGVAAAAAGKPEAATTPAAATAVRPATAGVPKPSAALQKVLAGGVPGSVAEIKAMQAHVRAVAARVTRATVGVRIGGRNGSGVVVTAAGYVLTCAHVTQKPGVDVTIMFPDGRRAKGKTLGANYGVDAGLVKIADKPKDKAGWPFCPMGTSASLAQGQWCIAAGHPGGFRTSRTPPVRLGRVLRNLPGAIVTDCTIVSGDSGGPLFNMAGEVIGISSRIAGPLDANVHVPVDAYTSGWARLDKSEVWGGVRRGGPFLGVRGQGNGADATIGFVLPDSAAAKAGLKPGDVVTRFSGKAVTTYASLVAMIGKRKPGDKVTITVRRDDKTIDLKATLGKRG